MKINRKKKTVIFDGIDEKEYTYYTMEDLKELYDVFDQALQVWGVAALEEGDKGTCVRGAGIKVYMLPKGCRYVRECMVVSQPVQGNLTLTKTVGPALQLLKNEGIECWYTEGYMD